MPLKRESNGPAETRRPPVAPVPFSSCPLRHFWSSQRFPCRRPACFKRAISSGFHRSQRPYFTTVFAMTRHCYKCHATAVALAEQLFTRMTGTVSAFYCLGKSHAEETLTRTSRSHCENMSLASLPSQIAFFTESGPAPHALPFSSSNEPGGRNRGAKGSSTWRRVSSSWLNPRVPHSLHPESHLPSCSPAQTCIPRLKRATWFLSAVLRMSQIPRPLQGSRGARPRIGAP